MKIFIHFLFFYLLSSSLSVIAEEMKSREYQSPIEDNFSLKGGLSYASMVQKSTLLSQYDDDDGERESHSDNEGFGLNTSVGYKWTTWEMLVSSDILFGKLEDMTFQVLNQEVRGDGSFRVFSLSPMIRYYTPYTAWNRWSFYTSAGPTWSLHTFIIKNQTNGTDFDHKKRLSFENRGGSINVGIEEIVPYKETHPAFFEVGYSYMRSHRIFVVDATNFKDAITLKKHASRDFSGHYFIFRLGITLF